MCFSRSEVKHGTQTVFRKWRKSKEKTTSTRGKYIMLKERFQRGSYKRAKVSENVYVARGESRSTCKVSKIIFTRRSKLRHEN